jgi:antitoxin (DNA-binding transcriptional repressor) of toxin-antitoxin stability system
MKSISVREMKAHWSAIEASIMNGNTIEVTNRGKTTARLEPPRPKKVTLWDDHLETAIECKGKSGSDTILESRGSRW